MATYTLTQNLYALDETILALKTALLKKTRLSDCQFWLNELSQTMGDNYTQAILMQIYYDFYYAVNSEEFKTLTIETLFNLNVSPLVFILCQLKPNHPRVIYTQKENLPAWLLSVDARFHSFLRAVNKNHYHDISYHVHKLIVSDNDNTTIISVELVKILCDFYKCPFIHKPNGIRNNIQYVMAVYAKLHLKHKLVDEICSSLPSLFNTLNMKNSSDSLASDSSLPSLFSSLNMQGSGSGSGSANGAPSIPIEIAAFKLQRWALLADANSMADANHHLINDPALIAFSLLTLEPSIIKEINTYIKSQLSQEELVNFVDMPEMQDFTHQPTDILAEQHLRHQLFSDHLSSQWLSYAIKTPLWLARLQQYGCTLRDNTFVDFPSSIASETFYKNYSIKPQEELIPTFGKSWLQSVFPTMAASELNLFAYKMFDMI